jgi:hypothetical protein
MSSSITTNVLVSARFASPSSDQTSKDSSRPCSKTDDVHALPAGRQCGGFNKNAAMSCCNTLQITSAQIGDVYHLRRKAE